MTARLFRAPGRVNLIGEHTDYNDGFVLPAAIEFSTTARVTPRSDNRLTAASATQAGSLDVYTGEPLAPRGHWTDYVAGVIAQLRAAGVRTPAVDLYFESDVPPGAGLSSSAALEVSTALALLSAAGRELPRLAIAKLCQQAEIEFTGTRCGIMDQFISLHGQRHCAILLDCRSLEYEAVALPPNVAIVVANTMVKHELAGSEYNTRRADCEAAAALLGVASLREASAPPPGVSAPSLRARHVLSENARVHAFIEALAQGDLRRLGNCMEESHASLRDDYEVSCPELDRMLELARGLPGYYGGRMTGGGFGGCTVNLVAAKEAVAFVIELRRRYHESTGVSAEIYITQAASGAHEVSGAEA